MTPTAGQRTAASWAGAGSSSERAMTPETTVCLRPQWPPAKGTGVRARTVSAASWAQRSWAGSRPHLSTVTGPPSAVTLTPNAQDPPVCPPVGTAVLRSILTKMDGGERTPHPRRAWGERPTLHPCYQPPASPRVGRDGATRPWTAFGCHGYVRTHTGIPTPRATEAANRSTGVPPASLACPHLVPEEGRSFAAVLLLQGPVGVEVLLRF